MFKLMSLRRSFFTSLSCFKAEAVSKNANLKGAYKTVSGYCLYISENIEKEKKEGNQASTIKELSHKWGHEPVEIKKAYIEKASLMNEESKKKFESLPQEEKNKLIEKARIKREKKERRRQREIEREKEGLIAGATGMKKPPTAFAQFVREYRQKNPDIVIKGKFFAEMADMWKNLPENEREERVRKSNEELAKWKEKKNERIKSIENE